MSVGIVTPPILKETPPRKRFTRAEVEQMDDSGLFAGQRFELIEGDLIDKMGQKPPHAYVICLFQAMLARLFGPERTRVQIPIEVQTADQEWSLPEPDLSVLKKAKTEFQKRFPRSDELLLVIEVADSTVKYDLTTKRDLYARAGVEEYWVVDIKQRRLFVHCDSRVGEFVTLNILSETEAVSVAGTTIPVAQMLPESHD